MLSPSSAAGRGGNVTSPPRREATHNTSSSTNSYKANDTSKLNTSSRLSPPNNNNRSASTSIHAPTAGEYSLLKVELEQRKAELESKKHQIAKLEAEHMNMIRESEAQRLRDDTRRDGIQAKYRAEVESERKLNGNLQKELQDVRLQLLSLEEKQRAVEEENLRLKHVEGKLAETDEILIDRSRRLEQLLLDKRDAEELIFKLKTSDQTKVLEGRMEALNDVLAERDRTIEVSSKRLEELQRTNQNLQAQLAETQTLQNEGERREGHLHVLLKERDAQITRLKQITDQSNARIIASEAQTRDTLNQSAEHQNTMAQLVDELKMELHEQQRLVKAAELQLAEKDSEVALVRADLGSHDGRVQQLKGEISLMEERLRKAHAQIEERESDAAKDKVILFEQRNEISTLHVTCDTLRAELAQRSADLASQRETISELRSTIGKNEGVEEKLRVIEQLRKRQTEELAEKDKRIEEIKQQLLESEEHVQRMGALRKQMDELESQLSVQKEAVQMLHEEKNINAAHFDKVKEELSNEKGKTRVLKVQLAAEEDRRKDLERKVTALEATQLASNTTHGKYLALQKFVQASTSEASKAMELNSALLEEVRTLEGRCVTYQNQILDLNEERRLADVRVAEGDSAKEELYLSRERCKVLLSQLSDLKEKLLVAENRAADADLAELRSGDVSNTLQQRTEELLLTKQQLTAAKENMNALQLKLDATSRTLDEVQTKFAREAEGRLRDRDDARAQSLKEEIRYQELLSQLTQSHANMTSSQRGEITVNSTLRDKEEEISFLSERCDALAAELEKETEMRKRLAAEAIAGGGRGPSPSRPSARGSVSRHSPARAGSTNRNSQSSAAKQSTMIDMKNQLVELQYENDVLRKRVQETEGLLLDRGLPLQSMGHGGHNVSTRTVGSAGASVLGSQSRRNAARDVDSTMLSPGSPAAETELRAALIDRVEEIAMLNRQLQQERDTNNKLRQQLSDLAAAHGSTAAESAELRMWKEEVNGLQKENLQQQDRYLEQQGRYNILSEQFQRALEEIQVLKETTTPKRRALSPSVGTPGAHKNTSIMRNSSTTAGRGGSRTPTRQQQPSNATKSAVIAPGTPEPSKRTPIRFPRADLKKDAATENEPEHSLNATDNNSNHQQQEGLASPRRFYQDPEPEMLSPVPEVPPNTPYRGGGASASQPRTPTGNTNTALSLSPRTATKRAAGLRSEPRGAGSSPTPKKSPSRLTSNVRSSPSSSAAMKQRAALSRTPTEEEKTAAQRAADAKALAVLNQAAERQAQNELLLHKRTAELQSELVSTKEKLVGAFTQAQFSSPPTFHYVKDDINVYSPPRPGRN